MALTEHKSVVRLRFSLSISIHHTKSTLQYKAFILSLKLDLLQTGICLTRMYSFVTIHILFCNIF